MRKVLVYGSLKRGFNNHNEFLGGSALLGKTLVPGRMYNLGAFPGIRLDQSGSIACEVYEVNDLIVKHLDRLEGFHKQGSEDNFYDRVPVRFLLDEEPMTGEIYEVNKRFLHGKPVIESGEWTWPA